MLLSLIAACGRILVIEFGFDDSKATLHAFDVLFSRKLSDMMVLDSSYALIQIIALGRL